MRRRLKIGDPALLQRHDHVAWYGDGIEELYAVANRTLAAGANRNEKLLFIADQPDPAGLCEIDGCAEMLDSGQLEIHNVAQAYGAQGEFDAAEQLATLRAVLTRAEADGYRGIRVVADNTSLVAGAADDFERWITWEQLTDRFQAAAAVTGLCYFDRSALALERQIDLGTVHPVCSHNSVQCPFGLFSDDGAVRVTGALDAFSAERFRRITACYPPDLPFIADLSAAEFIDHRALMTLNALAESGRNVLIRGADPSLRKLTTLLDINSPNMHFA